MPTLQDLAPAVAASPAVEVTLSDIVTRSVSIPTNATADTPVRVRPINLKGLASIERRFGSFDKIEEQLQNTATPTADVVALITILVNQDRSEHEELTEETVGRMIDGSRVPFLRKLIEEMTRPLPVAAPAAAPAAPATTTATGAA